MTPWSFSCLPLAILVPRTARSTISGIANMPTTTGMRSRRSHKIERAEGVAQRAGLRVDADGGEHQADTAGEQSLDERRAGQVCR